MTRARLNPSYERCYLDKKWAGARGDTARARATQTPSEAARLRRTASAVLTTLYSSTTRRRAQRLAAPAWVGSRQPAAQRSRSRRSGRACGATRSRGCRSSCRCCCCCCCCCRGRSAAAAGPAAASRSKLPAGIGVRGIGNARGRRKEPLRQAAARSGSLPEWTCTSLRSLAFATISSRKPAAQGCRLGPIKASLDLKAASWRQFQRARVRAPPGWRRAMSRSFKARRRRAGLLDGRSSAAVIFLDGRRCQRPEAVAADAPPCTLVPHFEKRRTRGTRCPRRTRCPRNCVLLSM